MKVLFKFHEGRVFFSEEDDSSTETMFIPDDTTPVELRQILTDWASGFKAWGRPEIPIQYGYHILEQGDEKIATYLVCEQIN